MLSVLQYGVEVLKIPDVIVCGHYGCGGVAAAMTNDQYGIVDNWLRNIKDVYRFHKEELNSISDKHKRFDRLVELNVREQVFNVCKTSIVQNAWAKGQKVSVHGWVYSLNNGRLKDLKTTISSCEETPLIVSKEMEYRK